jgi:CRP/FNR family transcriptional regulator, dissimilatory nitrate respiration regulator
MQRDQRSTESFHNKYSTGLNTMDLEIIAHSIVFKGISGSELSYLLRCLYAKKKDYKRGDYLWHNGDEVSMLGVVLNGSVDLIKEDIVGRRTIITTAKSGEVFGEGLAASGLKRSPVSVLAAECASVCFLNYQAMITHCDKNCIFHTALIGNLMEMMSEKLLILNRKLDYSMMKSIREKISRYLMDEYGIHQKRNFVIPYNREELADYFSVDRSSLSRELSKMQTQGLIGFHKNHFTLHDDFFNPITN